jgi:hypothetical protein
LNSGYLQPRQAQNGEPYDVINVGSPKVVGCPIIRPQMKCC